MTSGIISVLGTLCFDRGYMYCVSLRGFWKYFTRFSTMHFVSLLLLGISRIFSVKVDSDPVVVDVPVGSFTGAVCEKLCDLTVAACGSLRQHLCRGAEADAHGLVQETIEILQLQYTDKVIDVFCAGPALECRRGGDGPGVVLCELVGPCAQAQGQGLPPAIRAGKGRRGRRESDSQVFCHPSSCT